MDLPTAIEKYWAQAVGVSAGAYALVKAGIDARAKRRADEAAVLAAKHAAKLDLTKLAHEAAADVVKILRDEVERLSDEVAEVRGEMHDMQREHSRMMADKDARIELLEGRNRQLVSEVQAYRRILTKHEIPLPLDAPFFELEGGRLTPNGEPHG